MASSAQLIEVGPFDVWQGAARLGSLERSGARVPVLLIVGPDGATGDSLARARATAAPFLGRTADGVLTLVAVELVRTASTEAGTRVGWAYERRDVLSIAHALTGPHALPARAAAEVVARIAEIICDLPEAWRHRGPEPADVLVTQSGEVLISDFVGPFPPAPSMRAPNGEDGEAAAVYRLGVLLAQLLTGSPPSSAADKAQQAANIRRVLIRAMAKPGPILADRYADWLHALLAWHPMERPALSTVADGLRMVAAQMAGETLSQWANAHVEALRLDVLRARAAAASPAPLPLDREATGEHTRTDDVSADRSGEFSRDDEPTQEESRSRIRALEHEVPSLSNPGLMPITVGPPPEALRDRPRLPSGFLQEPEPIPEPIRVTPRPKPGRRRWIRAMVFAIWGLAAMLLIGTALLLALYLLLPPRALPDDPGLSEALQPSATP